MKRSHNLVYLALLLLNPIYAQDSSSTLGIVQILLLSLLIVFVLFLVIRLTSKSAAQDNERTKQLEVQNKQLSDEQIRLTTEKTGIEKQRVQLSAQLEEKQKLVNDLEKKVAALENNERIRLKEFDRQVDDLKNAQKQLEEERTRVIEDERKKREEQEENRNRIWNEHEANAKAKMHEICKKQSRPVPTYDNTNLPEDFDPGLKPDFMVRLLKQYIIFDPKYSTAKNLNTYIQTQVKSTAAKIKKSKSRDEIYPTVFFIIPGIGLEDIKESYFVEQGYSFFVIPIESFEPIIKMLQRLEEYELTEEFDPQSREKVVNLIALLNQYVRQQNATNILSVIQGFQALAEISSIPQEIFNDVESRRKKQGEMPLTPQKIKKLMENPREQVDKVLKMIEAREPDISPEEIKNALDESEVIIKNSDE